MTKSVFIVESEGDDCMFMIHHKICATREAAESWMKVVRQDLYDEEDEDQNVKIKEYVLDEGAEKRCSDSERWGGGLK